MLKVSDVVRVYDADRTILAIGKIKHIGDLDSNHPLHDLPYRAAWIDPLVCFEPVAVEWQTGTMPAWRSEWLEKVDRLTALILGGQRNA